MYIWLFMVVLGGEEEEGAPTFLATEAAPHHYAGGMLHVGHHVLLLVPAHRRRPPNLHRPGVHEPERRLVAEHDVLPVGFGPGPVFFAESDTLPNHFLREERLLGGTAGRHPQPLLANGLDRPHRQV